MLEKCVLTILESNWNQRLGHKKSKLNIFDHVLTSSTQLQNRSFHVVERTRTSSKCQKMKNARAKRAKNTVFHCQMCKFVWFLLPSSSWLLKLPKMKSTTRGFLQAQAPVSQKSRNNSGLFRVPQFPLYTRNGEVQSHKTSESSWDFLH